MSYNDYEVEYHLTPSGWKRGTSYYYGHAQGTVEPPPDRVHAVIRHEKQASGWSREEVSWGAKWTSSGTSEDVLNSFIAEFGELP
jgi:hypothetical protein